MEYGAKLKKKNIIIILLLILLAIFISGCIYLFFNQTEKINIFSNNRLNLPIYEVSGYNGKLYFSNELANEEADYKLSKIAECQYDNCYWYDDNHAGLYSSDWIFYDNNYKKDGGYYFYDHENFKVKNIAYKSITLDVVNEGKSNLESTVGAIVTDKNNKYGYYSLVSNNIIIPTENYSVLSFGGKDIAIKPAENSKYAIYDTKGKKLTDNLYDNVINTEIFPYDLLITEKDGKYNGFDCFFASQNKNYNTFDEGYDYLNFVYYEKISRNIYYLYTKNSKLYISRGTPSIDVSGKPFTVDDSFNKFIVDKVDITTDITSSYEESDSLIIVGLYDGETEMGYSIDINTGKINTLDYDEQF